ncbi:hypothetical protein DERF_012433 [Dermatophagoides farinae]|uniref:Uncharacterized protein n=1 Tax=Dermatophagoides farinae TaxID=6954 RepID=A0A922HPK1_DERFA|nr:hypothetical protein DERF_012433 [Dermatophagoides farinae]
MSKLERVSLGNIDESTVLCSPYKFCLNLPHGRVNKAFSPFSVLIKIKVAQSGFPTQKPPKNRPR